MSDASTQPTVKEITEEVKACAELFYSCVHANDYDMASKTLGLFAGLKDMFDIASGVRT